MGFMDHVRFLIFETRHILTGTVNWYKNRPQNFNDEKK